MILNANDFKGLDPGDRLLMGPGPSDVPRGVLQAMGLSMLVPEEERLPMLFYREFI